MMSKRCIAAIKTTNKQDGRLSQGGAHCERLTDMKKLTLFFGLLVLLSVGAARAQIHANVTVNVAQATPTIALSSPPVRIVNVGQTFTWQATVQGVPAAAPTGDILISASAANAPTALSSGPIPLFAQNSSGGDSSTCAKRLEQHWQRVGD